MVEEKEDNRAIAFYVKVTDSYGRDTKWEARRGMNEKSNRRIRPGKIKFLNERGGQRDRKKRLEKLQTETGVCHPFRLSVNTDLLTPPLLLGNAICVIYCACLSDTFSPSQEKGEN